MQIHYPSHHSWTKPISGEHVELLSESARKKLQTTIKEAQTNAIALQVKPLDDETLAWFIPMYEKNIGQKQHPRIFNVRETTLHNPDQRKTYFSLSLFEQHTPIGATIFSITNDRLSIAYRTYRKAWLEADLPTTPSLFAEWAITDHAAKHNVKKFIHGRNHNPYGVYASIGLAIFKLSVGCIPRKSKSSTLLSTDIASFTEDVFVLVEPETKTKRLSVGYLIIDEKNFSKYEQITKYPKRLQVKVIFRKIES